MSRRRPVEAALVVLVVALVAGCAGRDGVPTYTVEPRPFVQRVTADGVLAAGTVTPVGVPQEVRSMVRLAWVVDDGAVLAAGDVVARFDPKPMEERLQRGRSQQATAGHRLAESRAQGEGAAAGLVTQLEMSAVELSLAERFQKSDDGLWSRHEVLEAQIDEALAHERRRHAEGQRETRRELMASETELHEIDRRQATRRIEEAEAGLAALEVRAPHAGLFTRARDWQGEPIEVGRELWRGQELGQIPDLGTLQAEVFVLEADAGGVAAGQEAEVVVEAWPGRVFPATVERVDAVAKPRERGSPVQYFGVTLALTETDAQRMKPGQRVRATIYLERRDAALVVPRQAVARDEDGGHRVFVLHGVRGAAGFAPRAVELGAASRGLVVVTSGLAAGDVVALRPPDDDGDAEREPASPASAAPEIAAAGAAP